MNYFYQEQQFVKLSLPDDLIVYFPCNEGGGNNFYGKDIPEQLKKMSKVERGAYILMQRIFPPPQNALMLTKTGKVNSAKALSELGIYGAYYSSSVSNDNTREFIIVVRNSGTYKYYINQNLNVTRTGYDSKTFNSNDLVIAWDYRNNGSGFEGNLGAIYFYNSDLTTDQVVNNYNATKSRYGH